MVLTCHWHPRREQQRRDPQGGLEEEKGRRGCRPRAEIPLRQHWKDPTGAETLLEPREGPVLGQGRWRRREERPGGAGRDQLQPISTPMPLGVTGEREEMFNFFFSFSPFKSILIDNTRNFPHYVSGLPVTAMGH